VPRWLADLRLERSLRYLGGAVFASFAVALLAGFMILAYQLTAARVPEHRAALEHLVRAETGLDLRFEQLSLRWGWYGPEAVFSRVELGEPGRASALLRAPELIVAFDAWRTVQSGRLQAGRITLVAPTLICRVMSPLPSVAALLPQTPRQAAPRCSSGGAAAESILREERCISPIRTAVRKVGRCRSDVRHCTARAIDGERRRLSFCRSAWARARI